MNGAARETAGRTTSKQETRPMKIAFSQVASLIRIAFPEAKTRRPVGVRLGSSYTVRDFWDGGTRDEARFVELSTGRVVSPQDVPALREGRGYRLAMGEVTVADGYAVVEHSWFCGKDCGYSILVGTPTALSAIGDWTQNALADAIALLPRRAS
jgi:hypothetical protein